MAETTFSWRAVFVSAVLGGALGYVLFARTQTIDAEPRTVTTRPDLYPDELDTVNLFKKAAPSVVFVTATKGVPETTSGDPNAVRTGTGSGIVWDDAGHIVTNFHVIGSFDQAMVRDVDGHEYDADVIGVSPENDLAVLKITPATKLQPIPVGTSHDLQVGQRVYAIGNPFGLDHTLTTGIVSAVGRAIPLPQVAQPIQNVIQTDAAINPGNSGGPLLDSAGRLIGVNSALYSPSGMNVGVGFAIPVDTVNQVVPQLIKAGRGRPSLGLVCNDRLSEFFQRQNGTNVGVAITGVLNGSAAQTAGLKPAVGDRYGRVFLGDVLLKIDDTAVRTVADVESFVNQRKPGDSVVLTYVHEGRVMQKKIMLDSSMNTRG